MRHQEAIRLGEGMADGIRLKNCGRDKTNKVEPRLCAEVRSNFPIQPLNVKP